MTYTFTPLRLCQKLLTASLCLVVLPCFAQSPLDSQPCVDLLHRELPNVTITQASLLPESTLPADANSAFTGSIPKPYHVGAHCLVHGTIDARQGVGGVNYATHFEMRMPLAWNGKFLFQGGGGMDGFIAPALGSIPSHGSTALPALVRGYAVVSMDGGHTGNNASFGADQQARIDYAYASIGKVTDTAKWLIHQFYGKAASKSVFMGCSNGGREAMIAAERYPTQFDGIVAGDPGFRLSKASIAQAWDIQTLMPIAPRNSAGQPILSQALTPQDLNLVSQAVINACDNKDGIKDGIINNWRDCHFQPQELQCHAGQQNGCLSREKINALTAIFSGAHNSQGQALYSDWPYDSGINSPGWRSWKLGSSLSAQSDARNITLGADSLPHYFMTPPDNHYDPMKFNIDKDPQKVAQMSALNDATSTMLTSFSARGGKMIIFQGMSDPVFSANDIIRWYQLLQHDNPQQDVHQYADLFLIPGMTHCGDGPSLDNFDPLSALENWMDKGTAPRQIAAQGKAFPGKQQPLCPYPQVAMYQKGKDANSLNSYICQ
jgi:pimeloyl-ACP methyl ester carboxylesterase